jgi:hypothetical protein
MVQLLHLNRPAGPNGETDPGSEITVCVHHIVFIEHCHDREPGNSRILLTNGKIIHVDETQDQIRDMANESV